MPFLTFEGREGELRALALELKAAFVTVTRIASDGAVNVTEAMELGSTVVKVGERVAAVLSGEPVEDAQFLADLKMRADRRARHDAAVKRLKASAWNWSPFSVSADQREERTRTLRRSSEGKRLDELERMAREGFVFESGDLSDADLGIIESMTPADAVAP